MTTASRVKGFIIVGLFPALLIYLVFVVVPIIWSVFYGFLDWKGIGAANFIGFDNYIEAITNPIFWRAFKNNLIIVGASIFGQVPIALVLSLVLWKNTFFHRFIRSAVFMPMVIAS
jgi:raffinose/stachyose/melibiose transport system permease protein